MSQKFTSGTELRAEEHMPRTQGSQLPLGQNVREIIPPAQQPTPSDEPQLGLSPIGTPVVDPDVSAPPPKASDTLTGPTSAELHTGLGHPGSGMTSHEVRHDGKAHRKREGGNVQQYGPQGGTTA
ncbi:hypothetical protein OF83DRAFT_1118015 [Amylostereum chailletii]|nr:hypothetical protein OF83DRAFT_1118015 [Amylostereum chailletii]